MFFLCEIMISMLVINRTVIPDTLNSDNYIDKFQYSLRKQ